MKTEPLAFNLALSNSNKISDVKKLIKEHENHLKNNPADSVTVFKNLAFSYAQVSEVEKASKYAQKYIANTGEISILYNQFFSPIKTSKEFKNLENKYLPRVNFWSILYLYSGCVGIFIALLLLLKTNITYRSNLFIGLFVLLHSLFITHISLFIANYNYQIPHTLYATTTFSFLYGPLLYFYFKSTIKGHNFKLADTLHLLPTLALLFVLVPIYFLDANSKLLLMINRSTELQLTTLLIIIAKTISLGAYAYAIHILYKKNKSNNLNKTSLKWQKQLKNFFIIYVLTYCVYGASIIVMGSNNSTLAPFQPQIVIMAALIFFIAHTAFSIPEVFGKKLENANPILKYQKSGLTSSFSIELKQTLLSLLDNQEIYIDNQLSLDKLAQKLGTTKHNTSQVINEHFNMNFFELINSYRIKKAIYIFKNSNLNHINIIDVAYQVGFNNKVTFNKAFKKYTSTTPSEFINNLYQLKYA